MATIVVLVGLVLAFALVFAAAAAFLQRRSQRGVREDSNPLAVSVSPLARFVLARRRRPVYVWTAEVGRGSLRLAGGMPSI